MAEITMYATTWCPYCRRARELLQSKGQSWNEIDVEEQPAAKDEMMTRRHRASTVAEILISTVLSTVFSNVVFAVAANDASARTPAAFPRLNTTCSWARIRRDSPFPTCSLN